MKGTSWQIYIYIYVIMYVANYIEMDGYKVAKLHTYVHGTNINSELMGSL